LDNIYQKYTLDNWQQHVYFTYHHTCLCVRTFLCSMTVQLCQKTQQKKCQNWTVSNALEVLIYNKTVIQLQQVFSRNILDCDQSNYSSRIILSHIPAKILSISCKWLG